MEGEVTSGICDDGKWAPGTLLFSPFVVVVVVVGAARCPNCMEIRWFCMA